jgi:topoisomerase-4 subunit A
MNLDDLKGVMKKNFLTYASYVIKDRAIPDVGDGLKPVQRRILWMLHLMDDGKLHKVANVAGQTMALHPHGDAPITDALVNLANKDFLLDKQGNFGNLYTGDPASASRYIETRLSDLARETMFNSELTQFISSYDARNKEPITLPAKIPLLLMQGAEGIAVGMATKILPHNFIELLEAQIAILRDEKFILYPDFPTGGIMDPLGYEHGQGKVKLRARMETPNDKTVVIKEICYGTTTDSLMKSIEEAAKKGKIKIDSINDYTAEKVEIEIKLPRGQYAIDLLPALYAYTECEVTLHSQVVVIKNNLPWETTVDEILRHQTGLIRNLHQRELELERDDLIEKMFLKSLEQLFIEKRMYKLIEDLKSYDEIHSAIEKAIEPYHKNLSRIPVYEDRERLLGIPIRKISRFDLEKSKEEIVALQEKLEETEKNLKNLTNYMIRHLRHLIKKYGGDHMRKTEIETIKAIDKKEIATEQIQIGFDQENGFIGTKVKSEMTLECTNFDKVLLMYHDGTYSVMNVPEKLFVNKDGKKVIFMGVADKKTEFTTLYKDPKSSVLFAKRFIVKQFILEKEYRYFDEEMKLEYFTTNANQEMEVSFKPAPKQKVNEIKFRLDSVAVKGVSANGIRVSPKPIKKIKILNQR